MTEKLIQTGFSMKANSLESRGDSWVQAQVMSSGLGLSPAHSVTFNHVDPTRQNLRIIVTKRLPSLLPLHLLSFESHGEEREIFSWQLLALFLHLEQQPARAEERLSSWDIAYTLPAHCIAHVSSRASGRT